ncbi:MAG: ADP-ribosylglycohydrolase family protein [Bacteroidota bacterium]|nr:ADP-ribosylglycohydrolase family protein [Bacteroidota bacterium]
MKHKLFIVGILALTLMSCQKNTTTDSKTISPEELKDKIAGGWAGKMIGVTYGAPTEFKALSKTFEDSIKWIPADIKGSMWQDDIYVQLTFMETMDQYGIDAPAKKFQELLAKAGYQLWHANMQARKNYFDSIFPPQSGSPEYSMHADDIDFQIESDYLGFMCPGMPQTATKMADKIGHIMNYGDGVYGGIFVAALYCEAFFESDIPTLVNKAIQSLPEKSAYYNIIQDVIDYHKLYPNDWRAAWNELEVKWGKKDICGAGLDFNIDATLNGAYIAMGLLYGNGDPMKTLEVSTRCGQDSDCNPSNAMAVLGVIKGFSGLPQEMQEGVNAVGDSLFIHTTYSFNSAVNRTYEYALELIQKEGGKVTDKEISIKVQQPQPLPLEISFPNTKFERIISVFDDKEWKFTGDWKAHEITTWQKKIEKQAMVSGKAGDTAELKFTGTGISIEGNWYKDGGKADVFVDGKLHRTIDTYYFYANQEHTTSIWHVMNLQPGEHTVKLVVKGEKRPEATGMNVYITKAFVFTTASAQ